VYAPLFIKICAIKKAYLSASYAKGQALTRGSTLVPKQSHTIVWLIGSVT